MIGKSEGWPLTQKCTRIAKIPYDFLKKLGFLGFSWNSPVISGLFWGFCGNPIRFLKISKDFVKIPYNFDRFLRNHQDFKGCFKELYKRHVTKSQFCFISTLYFLNIQILYYYLVNFLKYSFDTILQYFLCWTISYWFLSCSIGWAWMDVQFVDLCFSFLILFSKLFSDCDNFLPCFIFTIIFSPTNIWHNSAILLKSFLWPSTILNIMTFLEIIKNDFFFHYRRISCSGLSLQNPKIFRNRSRWTLTTKNTCPPL